MNLRKVKVAAGKMLYACFAQFLPMSFAPIKIGQKKIRAFCGKLILARCGRQVNIERRAIFSSKVELGCLLPFRASASSETTS